MEPSTVGMLSGTAAIVGFVHTIAGPDHYVPFIALSLAGRWSFRKTVLVTLACGIGHVLGSVALGGVGIGVGAALHRLDWTEGIRGNIAGWLLLGFGLAYLAWGVRRAIRRRPHVHWHAHADGLVHAHPHTHQGEHAHVHAAEAGPSLTPWVLFTIFVFGPCEPLIPLLMYPAALHSVLGVVVVTAVFGVITIATMTIIVALAQRGLWQMPLARLERFSHAAAGFAVASCGAAVTLGF